MIQYLTDTEKLAINGILAGGNDAACDSYEPLGETPSEGPRFPYSAIRDRIKDYAPPVPRSYAESVEHEETPDADEDEDLEGTLKAFCRSKQNHEFSPWVLPSARSRRDVMAEYASMGMTMAE